MRELLCAATAFFTTLFCVFLLKPLANKIDLIDSPTHRKHHHGHIPLIGGISMAIGFVFGFLLLPPSFLFFNRPLIAGALLLVFIGALDDFHEIKPFIRIVVQLLAALMMVVWGQNKLSSLGSLFSDQPLILGSWAIPFTIIAVIGTINAFNMLDGVDGLSGSVSLIAISTLTYLAYENGNISAIPLLLLILAVLIAYLFFNFPFPKRKQALIFMGDAGSTFLGFLLVWFLVLLSQGSKPAAAPANMLWIVALPLYDAARVMLFRIYHRKSPFHADRTHLHHVLADKKFSPLQITLLISLFTIFTCGLAVASEHFQFPENKMFIGFLVGWIVYCWRVNRWVA